MNRQIKKKNISFNKGLFEVGASTFIRFIS